MGYGNEDMEMRHGNEDMGLHLKLTATLFCLVGC